MSGLLTSLWQETRDIRAVVERHMVRAYEQIIENKNRIEQQQEKLMSLKDLIEQAGLPRKQLAVQMPEALRDDIYRWCKVLDITPQAWVLDLIRCEQEQLELAAEGKTDRLRVAQEDGNV